jgi:PIN domain nuclease of toxin-antitoxin system
MGVLFSRLRVGESFIPIDLSLQDVEKIHSIPLIEIHDRIIVATSEILGANVLTKDEEITEYTPLETIWN